jgi:cytochrome b561
MGGIFLHKALSLFVMYLGVFRVAVPLVERSGNRQWRHVPYEALCLYCLLACIPVVGALGAMMLLAR